MPVVSNAADVYEPRRGVAAIIPPHWRPRRGGDTIAPPLFREVAMIVDKLENAGLYYGMGERLAAALRYVQQTDFQSLKPGRYDVRGDEIYALVQHYTPRAKDTAQWEAHRKYYDVQL